MGYGTSRTAWDHKLYSHLSWPLVLEARAMFMGGKTSQGHLTTLMVN